MKKSTGEYTACNSNEQFEMNLKIILKKIKFKQSTKEGKNARKKQWIT